MTRLLSARRTLASAALAPLLITGLAGCGDGSDDTATDATEVAAFSGLEAGDDVDPTEFVDTVADGVEASTTAHITMDTSMGSSGAMSAEGDIDYTTSPPSLALTMGIPMAGDSDLRLIDGIMYMNLGDLSDGKFWKIDPADPDGMFAGMGLDKMLDQTDPMGTLKGLEDGISSVTYTGAEDVDGRDLDHFELTIDMQAQLNELGSELPPTVEKGLPDSVTYDVWLDDEGRFAQLSMDYPIMGQSVSTKMTATDWGADVDIEAPPADQVADMPNLDDMLGDLDLGKMPTA